MLAINFVMLRDNSPRPWNPLHHPPLTGGHRGRRFYFDYSIGGGASTGEIDIQQTDTVLVSGQPLSHDSRD